MKSLHLPGFVLCALAIAACDPGSKSVTGTSPLEPDTESSSDSEGSASEGGDTTGAYGGNCVETVTVLAGPNALGPTGIAPAPIIADAEGTYTGSMRWLADEGPVKYQGAVGPTPVEIEVAYVGGEIRDVQAELVTPCEHDGPCPCNDRLEVDVQMRVVSADGVLDETWTVELDHLPPGSDDWFSSVGTSIYHRFDPDTDTQGTLSRGAFEIASDHVVERMIMTGGFEGGALEGALNVEVAIVSGPAQGSIGFGAVANFGAVTSLEACPGLYGDACAAAGCTAVPARPVYGTIPGCSCGDVETFCFPAPPVGDPIPTLYTIPDRIEEGLDLVYELDVLLADPPEPWRLCADAPEVDYCGCFDGGGSCS